MHVLIDASMPGSTLSLIQSLGHDAIDIRDIGLGGAPDADIAAYAQANGFRILTRDFDFADIRSHRASW